MLIGQKQFHCKNIGLYNSHEATGIYLHSWLTAT